MLLNGNQCYVVVWNLVQMHMMQNNIAIQRIVAYEPSNAECTFSQRTIKGRALVINHSFVGKLEPTNTMHIGVMTSFRAGGRKGESASSLAGNTMT
jgi:hypothetical protein